MIQRWASDQEAKHGMPLDQIPGKVYVLHYEVPQVVRSVSRDYAGPSLTGWCGRLRVGYADPPLCRLDAAGQAQQADQPPWTGDLP